MTGPGTKEPAGVALLNSAEKLCERAGVSNVYVAFLLESKYAHPTAISADSYLAISSGEPTLDPTPTSHTPLRGTALIAAEATRWFAAVVADQSLAAVAIEAESQLAGPD